MAEYKVLAKIGQGGMGVVYRAIQTSLDREVALKLLLSDGPKLSSRQLARFAREVKSIARIAHPNVIRILDYGQIGGRPFYAMDYLARARTLERLIHDGPVAIPRAIAIARQLLEALAALHAAGLVHRDLKPANVMIDDRDHVTLMDFGLVKDLDAASLTRTGAVVGTPRYLSPEAVKGEEVDGRSDLFSLGVLLYELVTGRPPFDSEQLTALALQIVKSAPRPIRGERPECPLWLADLIAGLMMKDRAARTPGAQAGLQAVRAGTGEAGAPGAQRARRGRPVPRGAPTTAARR